MNLVRKIALRGPDIVIGLAGSLALAIAMGGLYLDGCGNSRHVHAQSAGDAAKVTEQARLVQAALTADGQNMSEAVYFELEAKRDRLLDESDALLLSSAQDPAPASYRPDGPAVLNNLDVTPGVAGDATAAQLCSKSFHTGDVRSVSEGTKLKVCAAYGIDKAHCVGLQPDGSGYEIDHLISLELGGTNDPANLWPEPYTPRPAAKEKDVVENWLHAQVCAGNLDLATAQKEISGNWYEVFLAAQGTPRPDRKSRGKP